MHTKSSPFTPVLQIIICLAVIGAPSLALAHSDSLHTNSLLSGGLLSGLKHPFSGIDHLVVMLAIGLWSSFQQKSTKLAIPSTFLILMPLSACLATMGLTVPFIEAGIICSLIIMGVLLGGLFSYRVVSAILITSLVAFFHGYAHGSEWLSNSSMSAYILGFTISTAALLAMGFAAGQLISRTKQTHWVRYFGLLSALLGSYLLGA